MRIVVMLNAAGSSSFGLHKNGRHAIAALLVSISLHGLVLSFLLSQRVATTSVPRKESTSRLTVRLEPPGMRALIPKQDIVENDHEISIARTAAGSHRAVGSLRAKPQHSPDHEVNSAMADRVEQQHSSNLVPRVDIDAARAIARRFARESAASSTQRTRLTPSVDEQETVLGRNIAKAARPDCRTVGLEQNSVIRGDFTISGEGFLAIPFLIKNAVNGSGCKW
jgi:hypothetical protein